MRKTNRLESPKKLKLAKKTLLLLSEERLTQVVGGTEEKFTDICTNNGCTTNNP